MRTLVLVAGLSICLGAAAVADDEVLFSDDFTTFQSGWNGPDDVVSVSDGKLVIKLKPNKIRRELYRGRKFADIDLRLRVVETEGPTNQTGGVIFWAADFQNYYAAMVQADGQFYLGRYMNNKLLNLVPLAPRESIHKGIGQANDLRVITSGESAVVSVNDQEVVRFKGVPPIDGSYIGMHAESGEQAATWAFSQLSLRKGPSPATANSPRDPSLLYADDFSTYEPAWGDAAGTKSVDGGKLKLSISPNSVHVSLCQGAFFDDADIRIRVACEKGDVSQPAGIAFWGVGYKNCYIARIRPNGGFSVGRRVGDEWLSPVLLDTRAEVKQGLGQENQLRVVTSGRLAVVYVNDREVVRFRGFPPTGGSKVGIYGESGDVPSVWAFSDFSVRRGPPPSESDKPTDDSTLFVDDFSMLDPSWTKSDQQTYVDGGKLVLKPGADEGKTILYRGALFGDADIRLKLTRLGGSSDAGGALLFWAADINNYFAAFVTSKGFCQLTQRINGDWKPGVTRVRPDVLHAESGETNEMRVVLRGDSAALYVNDQFIVKIDRFKHPAMSMIGVRAQSQKDPSEWQFSSLRVVAVPKQPDSLPAVTPPEPLPADVVEAWTDAGAKVGWVRVNEYGVPNFVLDFGESKGGQAGDIPGFRLAPWRGGRLSGLPAPASPFGLAILQPGPTDATFKELARFKNLQRLTIFANFLDDAALDGIGELKGMQNLQLACPRLTDAGLTSLGQLIDLRTLFLSGTRLTGAGLQAFAGLKQLQTLNVTQTQVSEAAVDLLHEALPKCQIINKAE